MPRGRSPPSHSRTTTGSASGNQTLELRYDGENHARGNIYIYAPAQKLLVLIDVAFAYLAISSSIPGWISAHDKVLVYGFAYHVGGHLGQAGRAPTCWCRRGTCRTCELQASARPHGDG